MSRLFFAMLLPALTAFVPAAAAPVPNVPPDTSKDRDGYPLPKGATARLGSRPFHSKGWRGLAFSTDGKTLLAIPDAEQVIAWDTNTGKTLPAIPIKWGDESDGEHIIGSKIVGNRAIWITQPINRAAPKQPEPKFTAYAFDLANGSEVARIRVNCDGLSHRMANAVVSEDGKYLAVVPEKNKTVDIFDMATNKRLYSQKLAGVGDPGLFISPDSKTLYVLECKKPLRRFELVSGKELPEIDTDAESDLLVVSADGKRLAVRGWVSHNIKDGKELGEST